MLFRGVPHGPGVVKQGKGHMFRYSLVCLAGFALAGPAGAASWADSMFTELSKDFGSVPRGPTLSHPFRLVNNTGRIVTIANVRVSCGCTTATALKTTLNPGEETAILAQMDTRRFSGVKTVTIFVQFNQPAWEEVRLWVQANGRDDVSVAPETLAFGRTKRGAAAEAEVTVTFLGGAGQVTDAQSDSNYIRPTVEALQGRDGEASYKVSARLRPDAPVGKWYTDVWLTTNNPAMPRVRVPLTVEIESALSVSPTTVQLGQVPLGGEAERKVVVRGVKPFRITTIEGGDGELRVRDSATTSKPVHVLTVTVKGGKAGDIDRTLLIHTDLQDESEIEFQAKAQVGP